MRHRSDSRELKGEVGVLCSAGNQETLRGYEVELRLEGRVQCSSLGSGKREWPYFHQKPKDRKPRMNKVCSELLSFG